MFEMLEMEKAVILLAGLFVSAWIDLKQKSVYLPLLAGVGMLGIICHIFLQEKSVWNLLLGMLIGCALLLVGFLSGEKIGYGDGSVFAMTGVFLGFWENLLLLILASVLSGVAVIVLLFTGRKGKKDQIAFVPFIFAGYVLMLFLLCFGV